MNDPIERLLAWQPKAIAIRVECCDVCGGLMLSYMLREFGHTQWRERRQTCGFWCSSCDFSNAGSRPLDDFAEDEITPSMFYDTNPDTEE